MQARGALIVFEGLDRSGKTTQTEMLLHKLIGDEFKLNCELWKYPNRDTTIGKLIDDYLKKINDLNDHAVHLLFSANRWETVDEMKRKLNAGVNLIVDRYVYSGVAYSAAKKTLDFEWCKQCDIGLPKADLVCFLNTRANTPAATHTIDSRAGFGDERYEKIEFQNAVFKNYEKLFKLNNGHITDNCFCIDAQQSKNAIHDEILKVVVDVINNVQTKPIETLW